MDIRIYQGRSPSMGPADVCVVIDVIRAFTTAQVAFARGANDILLAADVDGAFELARSHSGFLVAGERDAVKVEGFDLGNSPAEFDEADIRGRGVVMTTTNGVRAALHANRFGPAVACGYRGADAVVRWLERRRDTDVVNLLASHPDGDEDLACAEYLRGRLLGRDQPSPKSVEARIRGSLAAQKFLDPQRPEFDPSDVEYCATRVDDGFVMTIESHDDLVRLVQTPVDDES